MLIEGEKEKVIKEIIKHGFKEVIVNDTINREIIEILRTNYNILVTITKEELNDKNYEYIYKKYRRHKNHLYYKTPTCIILLIQKKVIYITYKNVK